MTDQLPHGRRKTDRERDRALDGMVRAVRWQWFFLIGMAVVIVLTTTTSIRSNSDRINDINHERQRNIRDACMSQNMRHDATITKLDVLIAHAVNGASPARVRQIQQARAANVALIEALAPKQDCAALVARSVNQRTAGK